MQRLLTAFIDLLFPPSKQELLLRKITNTPADLYTPGIFKDIIYLSLYANPVIQAAVQQNKFHKQQKAASVLGTLLSIWCTTKPDNFIYIPIPLGTKRARTRGHNQVSTLIQQSSIPSEKLYTDILYRVAETEPQSLLPKDQRQSNVSGAFACHPEKLQQLAGRTIVLVDDVATTGATLGAARASLAPQLPLNTTLICLAIAH